MRRICLVLLGVLGAPAMASAQLSCAMTMTPVTFDTVTASSAGTYDARGMINVTCTGSQGANIAACVDVGQGAVNASGQRLLAGAKAAHTLAMQLFQDATLARPWGGGAMGQAHILQRTGDGPMTATVYARLYVGRGTAAPGTYAAQFPVTLRYGAVVGNFVDCNALGAVAASPPKPAAPVIPRRR